MILNTDQAQAIYSAMCALNNVSARIAVNIDQTESINVFERHDGSISVWQKNHGQTHNEETHTSQAAFAAVYGVI